MAAGSTEGGPAPRLALVTASDAWESDEDALPLVAALDDIGILAEPVVWDDPTAQWATYDLVVLRSPWDYTERVDEFLSWAAEVEASVPVVNPVEVLRWNTDKQYLGELLRAGLPVVPTTYLLADDSDTPDPESALPDDGQYVVKPTVSSGSRDTARYGQSERAAAAAHVAGLLSAGRDVMVQPYLESVDVDGETGMLFFGGQYSHAFRKGPLLTGGAARVEGLYAPEEIRPRQAAEDELSLARSVLAAVADRFGGDPLVYARVDVLRDAEGRPMLLELELTEPSYFLATDPHSAPRAAQAYADALGAGRDRHRK